MALLVLLGSVDLQAQEAAVQPLDTLPDRGATTVTVTPWLPIPEVTIVEVAVPLDRLPLNLTAHAISVLSPEVLHNTGTAALGDALEFAPGVDVRARGVAGIQSDVSIRGGTFEQAALVVDGMRWSAPHTAHHLMNLPFDPEDLRQVEVLRGGTGAFTGSGAMTGALHVQPFGQREDEPQARVGLEAGAWGWMKARLAANGSGKRGSYTAAFSHARTDGHIENTDALITRALWTQQYRKGDVLWRALAGLEDKAFGAQNFYTSSFPHQYEVTRSAVAQLTMRKDFAQGVWFAGAHVRHHRDRFELYREGTNAYTWTDDGFFVNDTDTAATWYRGPNRHRSLTAALSTRYEHRGQTIRWGAGVDGRYERIRSNALGEMFLEDAAFEELSRRDERFNFDGYANARWVSPTWDTQIGLTLGGNVNSRYGARALPAVEAMQRLGRQRAFQAFASAGRSLRHPSFTDLYYTVGGATGSEDLLPEFADQIELGLRHVRPAQRRDQRYIAHKLEWEMAGFLRRGADLIDWVQYDDSENRQAVNLGETTFRGAEASVAFFRDTTAPQRRKVTLRYVQMSAALMDADRESEGYTSAYVLDFLQTKVDSRLGLAFPQRLLLDVRLSHQERRGEGFDPVTLLGVTLRRHWTIKGLPMHTFLRVDNLLDQQIIDIGNVVQPGRWWRVGVTFDISLSNEN